MNSPTLTRARLSSIWLEITSQCQLSCRHCYANSSPSGDHGTMTLVDWKNVIDDAAELGCQLVQIIGGEPLLHPDFPAILTHATNQDMGVEVATNLVHVTDTNWDLLTSSNNVSLAVSYYAATANSHAAVTGTTGSHARTRANLIKAVELDIPVRGNIIRVHDDQETDAAAADLESIGVRDIGLDDVRGIGRGSTITDDNGMASLCGNCGNARVAVLPNGDVTPCVIGRRHVTGNILTQPLASVVESNTMKDTVRKIKEATAAACGCGPDHESVACRPAKPCNPDGACQPSLGDCRPSRRCKPSK